MNLNNPEALRLLERMDLLGDCWAAVTDLMIPDKDLHLVDRNKLSVLLGFLQTEYEQAREGFSAAIQNL